MFRVRFDDIFNGVSSFNIYYSPAEQMLKAQKVQDNL